MSLEAEAAAYEDLADDNTSLDSEFKKLTSNIDIDANLLALKKSMGLLPEDNSVN